MKMLNPVNGPEQAPENPRLGNFNALAGGPRNGKWRAGVSPNPYHLAA